MLEQTTQVASECVGVLGVAKRVFELPEDLRFAKHHGVESAGYPEYVANRVFIVQREEGLGKAIAQLAIVVQPFLQVFAAPVLADYVKLGPIAGRKQQRFLDAIQCCQALERPRHLIAGESDLLANFDRCRVMVQPEYLQRHTLRGVP